MKTSCLERVFGARAFRPAAQDRFPAARPPSDRTWIAPESLRSVLAIPLLLLLGIGLVPAQAAVRNWTNTLGGSWFAPLNWSPNGVPGGVDAVNITADGTYTVQVATGSVSIATL